VGFIFILNFHRQRSSAFWARGGVYSLFSWKSDYGLAVRAYKVFVGLVGGVFAYNGQVIFNRRPPQQKLALFFSAGIYIF